MFTFIDNENKSLNVPKEVISNYLQINCRENNDFKYFIDNMMYIVYDLIDDTNINTDIQELM